MGVGGDGGLVPLGRQTVDDLGRKIVGAGAVVGAFGDHGGRTGTGDQAGDLVVQHDGGESDGGQQHGATGQQDQAAAPV